MKTSNQNTKDIGNFIYIIFLLVAISYVSHLNWEMYKYNHNIDSFNEASQPVYPESMKYDVEFRINLSNNLGIEKTSQQIDDEVDRLLINHYATNNLGNKSINYVVIGQVNELNDADHAEEEQ